MSGKNQEMEETLEALSTLLGSQDKEPGEIISRFLRAYRLSNWAKATKQDGDWEELNKTFRELKAQYFLGEFQTSAPSAIMNFHRSQLKDSMVRVVDDLFQQEVDLLLPILSNGITERVSNVRDLGQKAVEALSAIYEDGQDAGFNKGIDSCLPDKS